MGDIAHDETELALKRLENDITKIYTRAAKECQEKLDSHLKRYERLDKEKRAQWRLGIITDEEYKSWRRGQIAMGRRWEEMCKTLATDLANADKLAESMTNGYKEEVYALNHNYGTFEVEKSSLVDTSYTLYDRQTVERLVSKNPQILPAPRGETAQKLREGKLVRWNMQKITGELTQGILQGESISQISKRMRNVVNMDRGASIRNARTAVTGAQNAGRQDSYERAENMGIKGKKMWVATMDARTRHWHVETDGQKVPIDESFSNEYGDIEYPGDTNASPANVYNCRCTMIFVHEGFEDRTDDWLQGRRNPDLGDITYQEWKDQHAKKQAEHGYPPEPVIDETPKIDWTDRIKEIQGYSYLDEDSIKEAGGLVRQEVDNYLKEAQENIEKARKKYYEAGEAEWERLNNDEKYKEAADVRLERISVEQSKYFTSKEQAEEHYDETLEKMWEVTHTDEYKAAKEAYKEAREALSQENYTKNLRDTLAKVREMGSDGLDIRGHLNSSSSSVRKNVEFAYSNYPKSWVEKSVQRGLLMPKKVDRGYYSDWRHIIAISGWSEDSCNSTAFHELGHRFERAVPGILEKEKQFYDRRTAGEDLKWLGTGYRREEKTRKDNFINSYMGKDYGGSAYELVSMGFEMAYCDPIELAKDEDMADWIYGLLATVP